MTIKELIEHLETFKDKESNVKFWLETKTNRFVTLEPIEKDHFVSEGYKMSYILRVG